jgi:hypothetical protein
MPRRTRPDRPWALERPASRRHARRLPKLKPSRAEHTLDESWRPLKIVPVLARGASAPQRCRRPRLRQAAPTSPIKTVVALCITVEGSGNALAVIEPFMAVNGIAFPSMSDSDVPAVRLAIVIVSLPEKLGLAV